MALAEGRVPSLATHRGSDSLSYLAFNSRITQLLPPPRPLARDSRLAWSNKSSLLISMPTSSLLYILILHLPKSPPASVPAAVWPPVGLLGHQWDLWRTLKGHRVRVLILPLVRPAPAVIHTSWFLAGSKNITAFLPTSLFPSEWNKGMVE